MALRSARKMLMPGVAKRACANSGLMGPSSVTSHTLSRRSRSRPVISRSWRCMNKRSSQACSQAEGATTTKIHCPRSERACTAWPCRSFMGKLGHSCEAPGRGVMSVA